MSIRLKLALLFTSVTLVLLLGVGAFFLYNLRSGLDDSLNSSLRTQADEVLVQLDQSPAGNLRLASDSYAQVLTKTGAVVTTSANMTDYVLLTADESARAARRPIYLDHTIPGGQTSSGRTTAQVRVRVYAVSAGRAGEIIAVASSREVVDDATERAAAELVVVGAIVLLLAGPGSWLLTRAALRPVERMRSQAAELQARDVGAGLTVPPTRDELGRLGRTLNELLARLHGAVEHERAFVADAGHELRTPLTILRGELELARRPGRSPEQLLETIDVAAEETERLVRLAEDLLVLAREEQALPIRRQSFDVVAMVDAATTPAAITSAGAVEFLIVGPAVLDAVGDPDRIRQALDNLIANAIRYSPDGGTIRIECSQGAGDIEVAVLDEGPGFDSDFLPYAFERFRRGDATRRRGTSASGIGGGTGLGLAIVRSILRAHGGQATAVNRTDRGGARVSISWPGEPLVRRRPPPQLKTV